MKADSGSRVSVMATSQFELHPIIRNFPAPASQFAMLRTLFIKDRIGVVHVDQNRATRPARFKLFKQATRSRKRKMADFSRRLRTGARRNQFLFGPERSIEQTK